MRDNRIRVPLFCVVVAFAGCASGRGGGMKDLSPILREQPEKFGEILDKADRHRVQVLIAVVDEERAGKARLERYGFRVDAEYFYPASTVKLCAAVASLQVLEELRAAHDCEDLLQAPMVIEPLFEGDTRQEGDDSNVDGGQITVGHEIRKLAIVSDNRAFNRLFDLVGHESLNERMHALGLDSVVINHRLSEARSIPDPLSSAAVTLTPAVGARIDVPARESGLMLTNESMGLHIGKGYMSGGALIAEPMDFTRRNGISLVDLQDLLIKVVRPDIDLGSRGLTLEEAHRDWLLKAMTEYPRESENPVYDAGSYPDDYCKMLLPGVRRVVASEVPGQRVEIVNKTGRAYGFTIENAYLRNPRNGRSVFVTAVMYTNEDGILNDDRYEYDEIALPFMADLGEFVTRRWLMGDG